MAGHAADAGASKSPRTSGADAAAPSSPRSGSNQARAGGRVGGGHQQGARGADARGPVPAGRHLGADDIPSLSFGEDGLLPVVSQDHVTGEVLMLAWANEEALHASLETGWMTYWSRSRDEIWEKGATSGHRQRLVRLLADCDRDAVLAIVEQEGPACHTGTATCWSPGPGHDVAGYLGTIEAMARARQDAPAGRYTDRLLADPGLVAAKVTEEAAEVARVLRGQSNDDTLEHEAADLLYHLVVALRGAGGELVDVLRDLRARAGTE